MFSFRQHKTPTQSSLSSGHASIEQCQPSSELDKEQEMAEEITIESMSAVIAAAVQISSSSGRPSSLSLGNASILQPFSQLERQKRGFFCWKRPSPPSPTLDSTSSISSQEEEDTQTPRHSSHLVDDGLDELVYRGIQIKQVKTTLKTLVIPDEVSHPMPEIKLERPSFARISY